MVRKLCASTKFSHQVIRWNFGILRSDWYLLIHWPAFSWPLWVNGFSVFFSCNYWKYWNGEVFGEARYKVYQCSVLTSTWRRSLSYRNQSIDLQSKSMDWFLNDRDFSLGRITEITVQIVTIYFQILHAGERKFKKICNTSFINLMHVQSWSWFVQFQL